MTELRTIFIGGLPRDCTERELHLLFYEGGSCEAIKLQHPPYDVDPHSSRSRCTAFVQFVTRERAEQALNATSGMVFDPQDPSMTLRVEWAKNNFRSINPGGQQRAHAPPPSYGYAAQPQPVIGSKRQFWQVQDYPVAHAPQGRARVGGGKGGNAGPNGVGGTGSSTLFIGKFGEGVSHSELEGYCAQAEGFVRLKMKDEGTSRAAAWAEFSDPDHAFYALEVLSTIPLETLGRAPNLELARADIGGTKRQAMAPMPAHPPVERWSATVPAHRPVQRPPPRGGSSTVFLGNLDACVTEEEVQGYAASVEKLVNVSCKGLGRDRATAWAQYESPEAAAAALEMMQQSPLPSMGRAPNVEMARADIRKAQ